MKRMLYATYKLFRLKSKIQNKKKFNHFGWLPFVDENGNLFNAIFLRLIFIVGEMKSAIAWYSVYIKWFRLFSMKILWITLQYPVSTHHTESNSYFTCFSLHSYISVILSPNQNLMFCISHFSTFTDCHFQSPVWRRPPYITEDLVKVNGSPFI